MNFKKIVITASVTFILLLITSMNSYAAYDWYYCHVTGAGMQSGTTFIRLTENSSTPRFTARWFVAQAGEENKTLAIALSAQTTNSTVLIYADPELPQESRTLLVFLTFTE